MAAVLALVALVAPVVVVQPLAPAMPALAPVAAAAPAVCQAEIEPNDEPLDAMALAGAACVEGDFGAGDQDLYRWTVPVDSAATRWSITVSGVWGNVVQVTLLDIEMDATTGAPLGSRELATAGNAELGEPAVLDGMLLAPGEYHLGVSSSGVGAYRLLVEADEQPSPWGDSEPNDEPASATPVGGAFVLAGDRAGTEDWYAWTLTGDDAAARWEVELAVPLGQRATLTLQNGDGDRLVEVATDDVGRAAIADLGMPAGTYLLQIDATLDDVGGYLLSAARTGVRDAGTEDEPNDDPATAGDVTWPGPVEGRLTRSSAADHFRLPIDADAAAYLHDVRLFTRSAADRTVCLLDAAGVELACRDGTGGVAVTNLLLPAGDYVVRVSGRPDATPYLLRVDRTSAPAAGFESEPNDDVATANPLGHGLTSSGRLTGREVDVFSLVVTQPELWHIEVAGRGVSTLAVLDGGGRERVSTHATTAGTADLVDVYLTPGEHWIKVAGTDADEYTVSATPLGPPDPAGEREPNDDASRAERLIVDATRTGRLVSIDDRDVYRFSLAATEHIGVVLTPPTDGQIDMTLEWGGSRVDRHRAAERGATVDYAAMLQPGDYELVLTATQPSDDRYAITLERRDPFTPPPDPAASDPAAPDDDTGDVPVAVAPLSVAVVFGADGEGPDDGSRTTSSVAAHWPEGQQMAGEVSITNESADAVDVALDELMSDLGWTATLDTGEVAIAPGATVTVPIAVLVPPDAPVGVTSVWVRAVVTATGAAATARADVASDGAAEPLGTTHVWPLPAELLGGLNVAATALGGEPLEASDARVNERLGLLFDGIAAAGMGFRVNADQLPVAVDVRLAGESAVPVAGVILQPEPLSAQSAHVAGELVRRFEVHLSADGSTFTSVLAGELAPLPHPQAFVLQRPVDARYARLVIIDNHQQNQATVRLAEWSVVAAPGFVPEHLATVNVADPALGGHVVRSEPLVNSQHDTELLLTEDPRARVLSLPAPAVAEWTIGFRDNRAALITALEWVDPPDGDPSRWLTAVDVAVSSTSPLGPWTAVGSWPLTRDAAATATLGLDAPTWARFVRVIARPPDDRTHWEYPATIRVIEAPTDDAYRSIVGEWGAGSTAAGYELTRPPVALPLAGGPDAGDTMADATPLTLGTAVAGRAHVDTDIDWYAVSVPADENTLVLSVRGDPSVGVDVVLFDTDGAPVPTRTGRAGASTTFVADVVPGATYYVEVFQPRPSIVFTFDTSISLANYEPTIFAALDHFAAAVVPGREQVHVLPFGEDPLLDDWSDDPFEIQAAIRNGARSALSSDGPDALARASELLAGQAGTNAILVLTDGDTSLGSTPAQWLALEGVRPRVFAVQLGAANDRLPLHRALMQDWASVNNGHYTYAGTHADVDAAFDRVATVLRRPVAYELAATAHFVDHAPPPDGSISVLAPAVADAGGGESAVVSGDVAVYLILDTSGSMRRALDSGTRASVAKQALTDLVTATLPPGTPVALRVFGREPDSCATELAVPLGPLDPGAMSAVIADLPVVDLVRTPLGASLDHVAADLAGVSGPKIVVLVTDGEETCDGDPEGAIGRLREQGIDVQVNIVGFALDDAALAERFAGWAELGGGRYLEADDGAELGVAIAAAVQAPFQVLDAAGTVVATGTVGGSVVVPPGTYTVDVLTSPTVRIESVAVEPAEHTELTLAQ